jgi:uncharacterized membrane protein YjdF
MHRQNDLWPKAFTLSAIAILLALGVRYAISARIEMVYDVVCSIIVIMVFFALLEPLHQDAWSYGMLLFSIILHDLALYSTSPFGIRFDHYMHFIAGLSLALIADRLFIERWSRAKRFVLIVIFALGIGVMGEIIEWAGYFAFGMGEGFFFYGPGDEGEWHNAMRDMVFNLLGGMTMGVVTFLRRAKRRSSR